MPRRILVVRLDLLGDLVMSLPAARALKESYPGASVTMLVTPYTAPLLRFAPYVDEVLAIDPNAIRMPRRWFELRRYRHLLAVLGALRRDRYDLAVSLFERFACLFALASGAPIRVGYRDEAYPGSLTVAVPGRRYLARQHEVAYDLALARAAGAVVGDARPELAVTDDLRAGAARLLGELGATGRPLVVCHVGASNGSAKRWPATSWARLCDRLSEIRDCTIVFTGAPSEACLVETVRRRMRSRSWSAVGKTGVPLLLGLIACADLVVSGDSAPVHLASAVRTPVIGIYGPTDPAIYGPLSPASRALSAGLPCSPCYNLLTTAECPWHVSPAPCTSAVTVHRVFSAAIELLDASGARA